MTRAAVLAALAAGCGADEALGPDARPPDAAEPDAEEDVEDDGTCGAAQHRFLPCPAAAPGKITVCGRVRDVATDELRYEPARYACDAARPAEDGVCALQIAFYDALDLAGNPTGAQPLPVGDLFLESCGRFVARDVTTPGLGYLAAVVDDAPGAPDTHAPTAVVLVVQAGGQYDRRFFPATTREIDAAWTAQAELEGASFVARGALLATFGSAHTPMPGVRLGSGSNHRTFYFADTQVQTRTRIVPEQTEAGPNGSAIGIGGSGSWRGDGGGLPAGCRWGEVLGAAVPGVLFFASVRAVTADGSPCE